MTPDTISQPAQPEAQEGRPTKTFRMYRDSEPDVMELQAAILRKTGEKLTPADVVERALVAYRRELECQGG